MVAIIKQKWRKLSFFLTPTNLQGSLKLEKKTPQIFSHFFVKITVDSCQGSKAQKGYNQIFKNRK